MVRLYRVIMVALWGLLAVLAGCTGDDDETRESGDSDQSDSSSTQDNAPRFCDAYLDYLADSTPANLDVVVEAADDDQVDEYADIITSDADITEVMGATLDLDELARDKCQPEWTAGVQGAGDTAAAAQAFFDAVVAGGRAGAANVAASNAIAVFEPWEQIEADAVAGTPSLGEMAERTFSMVLGPSDIARCEVATGVVIFCERAG